jgi:hypothetical protein
MEAKQKGGVRENSGRRKSPDPKESITVYIAKSIIQKNGGKVELRSRIYQTVENDFMVNPILERIVDNNKPENKKRITADRNTPSKVSQKYQNKISDIDPKAGDASLYHPGRLDGESLMDYKIRMAENK